MNDPLDDIYDQLAAAHQSGGGSTAVADPLDAVYDRLAGADNQPQRPVQQVYRGTSDRGTKGPYSALASAAPVNPMGKPQPEALSGWRYPNQESVFSRIGEAVQQPPAAPAQQTPMPQPGQRVEVMGTPEAGSLIPGTPAYTAQDQQAQAEQARKAALGEAAGPMRRFGAVGLTSAAEGVDKLVDSWQDATDLLTGAPPTGAKLEPGAAAISGITGGRPNTMHEVAAQAHPAEQFLGSLAALPPSLLEPKAIVALLLSQYPAAALGDAAFTQRILGDIGSRMSPRLAAAVESELHGALGVGSFSGAQAGVEGAPLQDVAAAAGEGAKAGLVFGAPGAVVGLARGAPTASPGSLLPDSAAAREAMDALRKGTEPVQAPASEAKQGGEQGVLPVHESPVNPSPPIDPWKMDEPSIRKELAKRRINFGSGDTRAELRHLLRNARQEQDSTVGAGDQAGGVGTESRGARTATADQLVDRPSIADAIGPTRASSLTEVPPTGKSGRAELHAPESTTSAKPLEGEVIDRAPANHAETSKQDLLGMEPQQLQDLADQIDARDLQIVKKYLPDFKRSSSRNLSDKQVAILEDKATPEDYKTLFQTTDPQTLRQMVNEAGGAETARSPEDLTTELSLNILALKDAIGKSPEKMTDRELAAVYFLRRAQAVIEIRGYDGAAISAKALERTANRLGNDGPEILEKFFKKESTNEPVRPQIQSTPASSRQVLPEGAKADKAAPAKGADEGQVTTQKDVLAEPVQTSARKEWMDKDRSNLGLAEINGPSRRSWEEALSKAHDEGVPDRAMRMAAEVNDKPRALSDVETAGMVVKAASLKSEHAAAMKRVEAATDPADVKFAGEEARRIEQDFDQLSQALRSSGTEKGRALASHKLTLDQDMSLVAVKARAKAAKGSALTEAESGKLTELTSKLDETNKRLEEVERQVKEQRADQEIRRHRGRERTTPKDHQALIADARDLIRKGCLDT